MTNNLKLYFPMIREREEILGEIRSRRDLTATFEGWTEEQQTEFLDFCTGVRGVKMLYDSFFKEIMNPEYAPERLNEFLSLLLSRQVKILYVLPTDSTRIADESSLLIMDIVVEFEDGSIANVEVQKVGYKFPGQRSACYSADLLLRQYKRIRGKKKKAFIYKDVKTVYTIVLFEKSASEFHKFGDIYLHHFKQASDSGLELELLQEYIFIPLDIFRENQQNKTIENKLAAWLSFLCMEDPEMIIWLIERYPEFKPMYEEVYAFCQNVEEVMGMFSKELLEMDRNTVQFMIDEMQDEIDQKKMYLNEMQQQYEVMERQYKVVQQQCETAQQRYESVQQQCETAQHKYEAEKQRCEEIERKYQAALQELNEWKLRRA